MIQLLSLFNLVTRSRLRPRVLHRPPSLLVWLEIGTIGKTIVPIYKK